MSKERQSKNCPCCDFDLFAASPDYSCAIVVRSHVFHLNQGRLSMTMHDDDARQKILLSAEFDRRY
jgi:hypothetical protein